MPHDSHAQSQGSTSSTSLPAAINTPVNTTEKAQASRKGVMRDRMPYRTATAKPATLASAALRLADRHGDSPATWEGRMFGERSCYRRVAQINDALCEAGMADKVAELMAPVDASVECVRVAESEHAEALTDATEDVAQSRFLAAPSVDTARALLRCRAQMRAAALADDERIAAAYGLSL